MQATTYYEQTKAYLEETTNTASYSVTELTENGMMYTSQFRTLKDAKRFSRKFTAKTSTVYLYKTACVFVYDRVEPFDVDMHETDQVLETSPSKESSPSLVPYNDCESDNDELVFHRISL